MRRNLLLTLAGLLAAAAVFLPSPGSRAQEAVEVPPPPEDFSPGDPDRGRELFVKKCATCHGEDGSGQGRIKTDPPARDLRDAERMDRRSDWEIYLVIRDGGKALGLSGKMFPWGNLLEEQEIRDLVAFVRSLSSAQSRRAPSQKSGAAGPLQSPPHAAGGAQRTQELGIAGPPPGRSFSRSRRGAWRNPPALRSSTWRPVVGPPQSMRGAERPLRRSLPTSYRAERRPGPSPRAATASLRRRVISSPW